MNHLDDQSHLIEPAAMHGCNVTEQALTMGSLVQEERSLDTGLAKAGPLVLRAQLDQLYDDLGSFRSRCA